MEILRALASLVLLLGILFLASTNRRAISWSLVVKGLLIQFGLAYLILEVDAISGVFDSIGKGFVALLGFAREGSLFLFGDLVGRVDSFGYIFAFQVLPTIVFFSAITSLLFHFGILQKVVWVFAAPHHRFLQRHHQPTLPLWHLAKGRVGLCLVHEAHA